MALTLVEAAKVALGRQEIYKYTIMERYAKSSDVLQYIPIENIAGNSMSFNREELLPSAGFRMVNQGYTASEGKLDRITESLTIAGGDLDVDKFIVDTMGPDQRAVQEAMKVKSLSLAITQKIIKGDITTSNTDFDGLQIRCAGAQLIVNRGGAASNVSMIHVDETIDQVESPTNLIMSKEMRRHITDGARLQTVGGYVTYDYDSYGRQVTKYNDLQILIADRDQNNALVLPYTETSAGGTATTASLYCVSFVDNGVVMLQNGDMDVRDLGELNTSPVFRTRVEWYLTLAIMRERAAARLYSIGNATRPVW